MYRFDRALLKPMSKRLDAIFDSMGLERHHINCIGHLWQSTYIYIVTAAELFVSQVA